MKIIYIKMNSDLVGLMCCGNGRCMGGHIQITKHRGHQNSWYGHNLWHDNAHLSRDQTWLFVLLTSIHTHANVSDRKRKPVKIFYCVAKLKFGKLWPENSHHVSLWHQKKIKTSQRELSVQKCKSPLPNFVPQSKWISHAQVKSDHGIRIIWFELPICK